VEQIKVVVTMRGNKQDVVNVLGALALVNECCVKGCSRKITLNVDGDGSARFLAYIGDDPWEDRLRCKEQELPEHLAEIDVGE